MDTVTGTTEGGNMSKCEENEEWADQLLHPFDHCKKCVHYHEDSVYDWCHWCVMEVDCYKEKEAK